MNRESSPTPHSSTAMRRLLSSHHSVYNTLTDPLLECASPVSFPDRHILKDENAKINLKKAESEQKLQYTSRKDADESLPPSSPRHEICAHLIEDPLTTFSSWQAINLSSFQDLTKSMRISSPFPYGSRPASASILSNSSDEDAPAEVPSESIVLVAPSKKRDSPQVLLFETDEEDDPDEDAPPTKRFTGVKSALEEGRPNITSSNSQRRSSVRTDSSQTFIMPRISLSEDLDMIQLMIVSSSGTSVHKDVEFLSNFIQECSSRLNISQVLLEFTPVADEVSMARDSDILIVINDGGAKISELITSMVNLKEERRVFPRLIVVNLLSSNYFANLFEIMRSVRPQQCIKTSSLKTKDFLHKVKAIIDKELIRDDIQHEKHSDSNTPNMQSSDNRFSSFESSSSSIEKPDYRNLEKTIRHEIVFVPEYIAIDPLNLSVSLNRVCVLVDIVSKFASGELFGIEVTDGSASRRDVLWFFCSFSVGVGLGIALNAFQVFKMMKSTFFIDSTPSSAQVLKSSKEFELNAVFDKVSEFANYLSFQLDKGVSKIVNSASNLVSWRSISFDKMIQTIKTGTETACESAICGLSKIRSLIGVWFE